MGVGLFLAYRLPRPDQTAAAPEFVQADIADRLKDREFYERRINAIRLREIADDRGDQ
jgi:hypothetical protein